MKYVVLAIGGATGTLLRFSVSGLFMKRTADFPWATFCVNLSGSFFIGLLASLLPEEKLSSEWRLFLFTGLLGGYTTFSSYSLESLTLFRSGQTGQALSYILASNVLGIVLAGGGYFIGRLLFAGSK